MYLTGKQYAELLMQSVIVYRTLAESLTDDERLDYKLWRLGLTGVDLWDWPQLQEVANRHAFTDIQWQVLAWMMGGPEPRLEYLGDRLAQ